MSLDFLTLMTVMAANLFMISAALPLIMGRDVSRAARHVQASMLLQAVAWAAIIASSTLWDQALSTVSIACNAAAQWMLYRALEEWLGPRPLRRVLLVLVIAAPLGYTLGFGHYAWRVGWANFVLATILCIVARATLAPVVEANLRWRSLLLGCRWEAEHKLRTLAMTDGLTGVLNRRGFTTQGSSLLAHAARHQLPMTAMMLDLDHFKQVNDTHGHEAGDRALQLFARLLGDTCRSGDLVGRLGGEEFGVLLLHNSEPAGLALDRRLRRRLHAASVAELGFALDYSAGMAVLQPGEAALAELMARADGALYAAKTAGRGRLVAAD